MKTLVLLCDSYPLSAGEFFLDDEIKIIHPRFEKIHVLIKEQDQVNLNRFIPENLQITKYNPYITTKQKLKALPKIFTAFFISELFRTIFKLKIAPKPILFKIMFMDIVRSNQIIVELKKLIDSQKLDLNNTIFYSYWHDYRALALARLRRTNKQIKVIARAHGWDVFADRHNPPYLPFKTFITASLSKTYSISETGKIELLRYAQKSKIAVSKLGKTNAREPIYDKNNKFITICSCSNIIPLKRIEKIIEVLSSLNLKNIKWIHFGDGILRDEIKKYAALKLEDIDFKFKGIVPNNEILDFYSTNYVDLFINLSESEGIPVSIMEVLSAGIPVVATNVGGTAEAVNEKNGFLIPKDFETAQVASIIENYLNSPSKNQLNYRQNAYNFWKQNFEATKNYSQFAEELLAL
jgi:glycosyltransferase involved in cell wall biosynthesis